MQMKVTLQVGRGELLIDSSLAKVDEVSAYDHHDE